MGMQLQYIASGQPVQDTATLAVLKAAQVHIYCTIWRGDT